jgi:superfamily II DNA or RNA helicase
MVDKHGSILYNMIKSETNKHNIHYVHGGVDSLDREEIRKSIEKSRNNIIVASYGTFRQGINLINLDWLIFAHPSKGKIRVLQSIGRGLRRGKEKSKFTVFDIGDDLTWKNRNNYTFQHLQARLKIYIKEKHKYKFYKVKL